MQFENKRDFILHYEQKEIKRENDDLPAKLKQYVNDIAKKEGYTHYKINMRPVPGDGGNFMAKLFEVTINGKNRDGDRETNVFVKQIIPVELLTMFSITEAYKKEVFAYTELLQIYNKLQKDANVPTKDQFKILKSFDESDNEFIILENISKNGFTTQNRLESITFDFAKLSIEQIAKFHALSFVLQRKQPEYFDRKLKNQKHGFTFDENWNQFIENNCKITMGYLDSEMKAKVEKIIPIILKKYPSMVLDTDTVCCLCHGDFRANNIMMKTYDDKVEEVILIDYQIIQYGSPINDLLYFIFGATDQQFRRDHLEHLKSIYHEALGNFLKYFDMDVNDYLPRKTFENLFIERLDFGLYTAIWFLPIILAHNEEVPDFSKQSPTDLSFKTDNSFKDRLEGILRDYVQWGRL